MTDLTKLFDGPEQWCKGVSSSPSPRCILNQLNLKIPLQSSELMDAVDQSARELFPSRAKGSKSAAGIHFNDHKNTTFADVQAVLKRAQEIQEAA